MDHDPLDQQPIKVLHGFIRDGRQYKRDEVHRRIAFSCWAGDWQREVDDMLGAHVLEQASDEDAERVDQPVVSFGSASTEAETMLESYRARRASEAQIAAAGELSTTEAAQAGVVDLPTIGQRTGLEAQHRSQEIRHAPDIADAGGTGSAGHDDDGADSTGQL